MFTQTAWDEEGFAIRDPDSTTYVGAIETAEEFGKQLYVEAWKRGWSRAEKKVVMGDGAEWIGNLAGQHFPGALQIVDLYHARQHLWELVLAPDYFRRNAERMRYPTFRAQHLFVGSGVIEAGCKSVIGSRLKRSGRFWTVRSQNRYALRLDLPADAGRRYRTSISTTCAWPYATISWSLPAAMNTDCPG